MNEHQDEKNLEKEFYQELDSTAKFQSNCSFWLIVLGLVILIITIVLTIIFI